MLSYLLRHIFLLYIVKICLQTDLLNIIYTSVIYTCHLYMMCRQNVYAMHIIPACWPYLAGRLMTTSLFLQQVKHNIKNFVPQHHLLQQVKHNINNCMPQHHWSTKLLILCLTCCKRWCWGIKWLILCLSCCKRQRGGH